jgi:hypothetical protein
MAADRELTLYEKRVDALLQLLPKAGGQARKTFLRTQKSLKTALDDAGYFDRWIEALGANLVSDGVITEEDLSRRLAETRDRLQHWEATE